MGLKVTSSRRLVSWSPARKTAREKMGERGLVRGRVLSPSRAARFSPCFSAIFYNSHFLAATRETAVIHAISAAAITDEITHQCRHNMTPGCGCPQEKTTELNPHEVVTWGCSDSIEFGEKEARRFTDRLETGPDVLVAVNLHNNEVGREVMNYIILKSYF